MKYLAAWFPAIGVGNTAPLIALPGSHFAVESVSDAVINVSIVNDRDEKTILWQQSRGEVPVRFGFVELPASESGPDPLARERPRG